MPRFASTTIIGVGVLLAALVGLATHAITDAEVEMLLSFAGVAIVAPQHLSDPAVMPKLAAIEDTAHEHTEQIATNGGVIADVQRKVTGIGNTIASKLL